MTARHRISADQLDVGAPLPVDVFDAEDRLLLRRGNVIATGQQLERLIDEGLFSEKPLPSPSAVPEAARDHDADAGDDDASIDASHARVGARPGVRVSVYAEVLAAARHLEALLVAPEANPGFVKDISGVADTLCHACDLDRDAALGHIMFAREVSYPIRQSVNVAILTALLLGRSRNDRARTHSAACAALTMNLSILSLQDVLYQQQAETEAQRQVIAAHPAEGARMLTTLGVRDPLWLALVEQHHELIDGSGYPRHLASDAVLREAQVITLADRYCAAVTERAYRAAIAPDIVIDLIRTRSGAAIDRRLIEELVYWVGIYPPGTVVVLKNRDVAVVTRRLLDPKHPVVVAVAGEGLRPYDSPRKRLTGAHPQFNIERVLPRETNPFALDPEVLWPRTVTKEVVGAAAV